MEEKGANVPLSWRRTVLDALDAEALHRLVPDFVDLTETTYLDRGRLADQLERKGIRFDTVVTTPRLLLKENLEALSEHLGLDSRGYRSTLEQRIVAHVKAAGATERERLLRVLEGLDHWILEIVRLSYDIDQADVADLAIIREAIHRSRASLSDILQRLRKDDLQEACSRLGLPVRGDRAELIERIARYRRTSPQARPEPSPTAPPASREAPVSPAQAAPLVFPNGPACDGPDPNDVALFTTQVVEGLPHPIALAWHRYTLSVNNDQRADRLRHVLEITLRTLCAYLLPDYLRGPKDAAVDLLLRKLEHPLVSVWADLMLQSSKTLSERGSPAPFFPDVLEWRRSWIEKPRRSPGGEPISLMGLVHMRNRWAHDAPPASDAERRRFVQEFEFALRGLLGSLRWMSRHRLFRIHGDVKVGQFPRFRGDLQVLMGREHHPTPVRSGWDALLNTGLAYVSNPSGTAFLRVDPFLQILPTERGPERCHTLRSLDSQGRLEMACEDPDHVVKAKVFEDDREMPFWDWLDLRAEIPGLWQQSDRSIPAVAAPPRSATVPQGGQLGRFPVRRVLGEGGMAVVYEVHDPVLKADFALKVLRPSCCGDERLVERFRREGKRLHELDHPNLVKVADCHELPDGTPCLKMTLGTGRTLRNRIDEGRASPDELLRLLREMLEPLAFLHGHGIVHRDVKPENFLYARDGRLLLADLGIARDPDQPAMTRTLDNPGTLAYMAPEQIRGEPAVAASDVFSVAKIAHELATGKPPRNNDPGSGLRGPFGELLQAMGNPEPSERPPATEALACLASLASPDAGPEPSPDPAALPPESPRADGPAGEGDPAADSQGKPAEAQVASDPGCLGPILLALAVGAAVWAVWHFLIR